MISVNLRRVFFYLLRVLFFLLSLIYFVGTWVSIYIILNKDVDFDTRLTLITIHLGLFAVVFVFAFAKHYAVEYYRKRLSYGELYGLPKLIKHKNESHTAIRLLKLILPYEEEQDSIIGDLIEEFSQFESRIKAYLWLYKQVLTSIVPLILKTVKGRLASYFGERIR